MLKTNHTTPGATRSAGVRRTVAAALLAAGATLGAAAQPTPPGPDGAVPATRMERGTGMHRPGMEGMHHGMGGPGMGLLMMGRRLDRMLDAVDASETQRVQIRQIAQAAAADLRTQTDAGRALRAQGLQIFATPTVDARAAESLRQRMLAQHDQASRRVMQAMLDVATVLTPEQRAKLAERGRQRAAWMQERMRDRAPLTPPASR